MTDRKNQRVILASRPDGEPTRRNFLIEETGIPALQAGQLLLEVLFLSLDPYMRGRMDAAKSYADPIAVGGLMEGGTVARVIGSRHERYAEGDIVLSHSGWQRFAVSDGIGLRKLDPEAAPISTALGVLGMPGFTAYSGLLQIGRPSRGETVVVAAASGAVGSAVGQIARIKDARAVGIAGGPEKCAFVRDELGFDAVVDHRAPDFPAQLRTACPDGIDIYFENVGGPVWDAVFPLLNPFARVPVCGVIAQYNNAAGASHQRTDRLPGLMWNTIIRRLNIRGFIQTEFSELFPEFYREASEWIIQGRLRYREDIVEGLENAPEAFIGMLRGRNFGKLIIRL